MVQRTIVVNQFAAAYFIEFTAEPRWRNRPLMFIHAVRAETLILAAAIDTQILTTTRLLAISSICNVMYLNLISHCWLAAILSVQFETSYTSTSRWNVTVVRLAVYRDGIVWNFLISRTRDFDVILALKACYICGYKYNTAESMATAFRNSEVYM